MLFKSACIATILLFSQFAFSESTPPSSAPTNLNDATEDQKLSYLLGLDMYEKRSRQGFTLDAEMVAQSIRDEQNKVQPQITSAEYMRMVLLKRERIAEFEASWQALSDKNLADGQAFMEKKALESGVKATDSGILYKILRPGNGERPSAHDHARVHYRGTLLNGEEFDSTFKRGKPIDFPVGKVKPAMKEILMLMREGAKWVFYAPPHLSYGEEGGGPIGPNETLTTEVELIEILN